MNHSPFGMLATQVPDWVARQLRRELWGVALCNSDQQRLLRTSDIVVVDDRMTPSSASTSSHCSPAPYQSRKSATEILMWGMTGETRNINFRIDDSDIANMRATYEILAGHN